MVSQLGRWQGLLSPGKEVGMLTNHKQHIVRLIPTLSLPESLDSDAKSGESSVSNEFEQIGDLLSFAHVCTVLRAKIYLTCCRGREFCFHIFHVV